MLFRNVCNIGFGLSALTHTNGASLPAGPYVIFKGPGCPAGTRMVTSDEAISDSSSICDLFFFNSAVAGVPLLLQSSTTGRAAFLGPSGGCVVVSAGGNAKFEYRLCITQ